MKYSIIIPVMNDNDKLRATLNSVAIQTCKDFEIVIQNAGESIETFNIASHYSKEYNIRIHHYSEKDQGIYDGMNKAVEHASGEYCIFLGAGDTFVNDDVLQEVTKFLCNENDIDIIYGNVIEIDSNGNEIKLTRKLNWTYKVKFTPVCHQAVFAKRKLLEEYKFNIQYNIAADQDWMLKMVSLDKKTKYINLDIAYYPLDGFSSLRSNQFVEEQKRIHATYYPFWMKVRFTWRKIRGK